MHRQENGRFLVQFFSMLAALFPALFPLSWRVYYIIFVIKPFVHTKSKAFLRFLWALVVNGGGVRAAKLCFGSRAAACVLSGNPPTTPPPRPWARSHGHRRVCAQLLQGSSKHGRGAQLQLPPSGSQKWPAGHGVGVGVGGCRFQEVNHMSCDCYGKLDIPPCFFKGSRQNINKSVCLRLL